MKRMLAVILAVCMMSSACFAENGGARMPSALKTIEAEAFAGDDAIAEIDLPWGTETIDRRAFASSGLRRIYIPSTVYYIAGDAFDGDVTILSNPASYAKKYADSRSLAWEDCESHYPQEGERHEAEEDWDEGLEAVSADSFSLEGFALLSAGALQDEETLGAIQDLNAILSEVLAATDEYNQCIQDLMLGRDQMHGYLGNGTYGESGSQLSFSMDGVNIEMDAAIQNGLRADFDEENGLRLISPDGQSYTVNVSGTTMRLQAQTRTLQRSGGIGSDEWWNRVQSIAENIKELYDLVDAALEGAVDITVQQIGKLVEYQQRTWSWYNGQVNSQYYVNYDAKMKAALVAERDRWLDFAEDKMQPIRQRQGKLLQWKNALAKVNIGVSIWQLSDLVRQHFELKKFRDHNHPTEFDHYEEGEDYSALLNKNIDFLEQTLAADAGTIIVSLLAYAATVISLMGAQPLALATVPIAIVSTLCGIGLNNKENELWDKVREFDAELHCSAKGVVLDKDTHDPIAGVSVSRNGKDAIATTDENGEFEVYLPRLVKTLVFLKENYKNTPGEFALEPYVPDFQIIYMERMGGQITGVVYDQDTRLPLEGAEVVCEDQVTFAGEDGGFTLYVGLGDHEVTASAEGYQSEKRDVTVEEENEQKVIDFPLRQRRAIHNREELEALAADANAAYYLANDIDLSGEPWVPNCWFGGSLDGCGHQITGMNVTEASSGCAGLFLGLWGGEVFNMTLSGASVHVTANDSFINVGGLAGTCKNGSKLKDVNVEAEISLRGGSANTAFAGGLTGYIDGADLENCFFSGSVTVEQAGSVYAGGLAGRSIQGSTRDCRCWGDISVTQTGSSSGSSYFVSGSSIFNGNTAEGGSADGSVRVYTTNGRGCVYGLSDTNGGSNFAEVTAVTVNGSAEAFGCFGGSSCTNDGKVTATATGSGSATASGVRNISGGINAGEVSAVTESGQANAGGAEYVTGKVTNNAAVTSTSGSGQANAFGIKGGTDCTNSGAVKASSGTGKALAIGIQDSLSSRNTGSVEAESDAGNVVAQGISQCTNSANAGNVDAVYTGESGAGSALSAQGLNNCTGCTNTGRIRGQVRATTTSCTVTGIAGGSHNASYGSIEARSDSGPAVARGAWAEKSQNYGNVYAASQSEVIAETSNATAYGAGNFSGTLNEGNVTAISRSSTAWAYGTGGGSGSVSTGAVLAVSQLFNIRTLEDGTQEGEHGFAYALNSTEVTAEVGGHQISASGSTTKHMYFFLADQGCKYHDGQERRIVDGSVDGRSMDSCSCYKECGTAKAASYGDYTMPE